MAETPEKMEPQKEADTPKNPEKKEVIPPAPRKGVPIDEAPEEKPKDKQSSEEPQKKQEAVGRNPEVVAKLEKQINSAKSMSNAQLMEAIFTKLGALIETLSKGGLDNMFGVGGPKFTPKQIEEVKVDIDAAEKKEYDPKSENKAVEFVCNALNLPVKNNVTALLYSLKSSPGVIYETDKNKLSEGKIGDVLFFRKEGEEQPHLAAIISELGPPVMMKYMNEKGEVKQEELLKSPLYEQEWFGLVKFPEKQKPNETPQS